MRRWSKWIVGVLAAGAVLALVILAFQPEPITAEIANVASGALQVTVNAEGRTRVRERFVISAPITGRLGRLGLSEGDTVQPGTLLARLAPVPMDIRSVQQNEASLRAAEAQSKAADAQVEQARIGLNHAERERKRMDELADKDIVAEQTREDAVLTESNAAKSLESAIFSARAAHFQVDAIRSAMLSARHDQPAASASPISLRSPAEGKVLRILQESERTVVAGTPILEIGDPSSLELVFDVLSADAVKIPRGAPIIIENWGTEVALKGHVRKVEPAAYTKISALGIEEQRVNVIGDFDQSIGALGDAYRVDGRIVIWESPNVLKVPISALFRSGDSWSVFTVEDGVARLRMVQIGHRNETEAEVLTGVSAGNAVVRYPNDNLKDGTRVRIVRK